jgi:TDG/mug DNA glycosylase family protein
VISEISFVPPELVGVSNSYPPLTRWAIIYRPSGAGSPVLRGTVSWIFRQFKVLLAVKIECFPPIASPDARILILGSMPGVASLTAGEYYAHPRNAFWPIMGELIGAGPELAYAARVRRLTARRIAVWDVLQSCVRGGSLDSSIDEDSIVPNDFAAFFAKHRKIARVYFNGGTAERVFRRYVLADLGERAAGIAIARLPSTSPAHAGRSFQQKLHAWRVALAPATDRRQTAV